MNKIALLFATIFALLLASPAGAQSQWSMSGYVDVSHHQASIGAMHPITPLTHVFGSNITLSLDGYAGLTLRGALPVAAVLVDVKKRLADQVMLVLGIGASVQNGLPAGWGFGASVNVALGSAPVNAPKVLTIISGGPDFHRR